MPVPWELDSHTRAPVTRLRNAPPGARLEAYWRLAQTPARGGAPFRAQPRAPFTGEARSARAFHGVRACFQRVEVDSNGPPSGVALAPRVSACQRRESCGRAMPLGNRSKHPVSPNAL